MSQSFELSIGQSAMLACCLEVSIPKPGNVHRSADFADTSFHDFLVSAVAIGPILDQAQRRSLGTTVYGCIVATRSVVNVNTNLGLVLLLAPLAMAENLTSHSVQESIDNSDATDCEQIYAAIRLVNPAGLASVGSYDIHESPPSHIVDAMRLAADRDLVAAQYSNGFREVFDFVLPAIELGIERGWSLTDAVIHAHLQTMHQLPDSLIARKNGTDVANQASALAGRVLNSGEPGDSLYLRELGEFDFWLRSDGNRRNPGTTADMIAAGLFVGLRRETIRFPMAVASTSAHLTG